MVVAVSGAIKRPDGSAYANSVLTFTRSPARLEAVARDTIIPTTVTATTDAGGVLAVDLYPGAYALEGADGLRRSITVPGGVSSADIADLIGAAEVVAMPATVQAAIDAADRAEAAAATMSRVNTFYQADYMHPDDLALIQAGNITGQDATRITDGIRQMHEDALAHMFTANGAVAVVQYEPGAAAINRRLMSDAFNNTLWAQRSNSNSRMFFASFGVVNWFVTDWQGGHAAVRTDGIWGELALSYPVPNAVWEWSQGINSPYLAGIDATINLFGASNEATDPMGFSFYNCQGINSRGILRVTNLRNTAWQFEACQNSSFAMIGAHYNTGWQPNEFGALVTNTLRYSPVGSTITIKTTAGVDTALFTSGHVGRKIALARQGESSEDPNNAFGLRGAKWFTITAVAGDGKSATISPSATYDIDADSQMELANLRFSFAEIRATTTAGSAVVTLSAPVMGSLVGRSVCIVGAGYDDSTLRGKGAADNLSSVVIAHSGDTITLAQAARYSVSLYPIVVAPQIMLSPLGARTQHASWNANDDMHFGRVWAENAIYGVVPLLTNSTKNTTIGIESKLHGTGTGSSNDFAGNFAAIVGSAVKLEAYGIFTHSMHSRNFGKFIFSGNKVNVGLHGNVVAFPDSCETALFWLDPDMSDKNFELRSDLVEDLKVFPNVSTGQVIERGSSRWSESLHAVQYILPFLPRSVIPNRAYTTTATANTGFELEDTGNTIFCTGTLVGPREFGMNHVKAIPGDEVTWVRTDAGAGLLTIKHTTASGLGTIGTLSAGQWLTMVFDGTKWRRTAFGG